VDLDDLLADVEDPVVLDAVAGVEARLRDAVEAERRVRDLDDQQRSLGHAIDEVRDRRDREIGLTPASPMRWNCCTGARTSIAVGSMARVWRVGVRTPSPRRGPVGGGLHPSILGSNSVTRQDANVTSFTRKCVTEAYAVARDRPEDDVSCRATETLSRSTRWPASSR